MSAISNVTLLELFRDHLSEIRELCGPSWPTLIQEIRPLLLQLAVERDTDEANRLTTEIFDRSLTTPAGHFVQGLTSGCQQHTHEVTRGGDIRLDAPHIVERAREATAGAAGNSNGVVRLTG